MANSSSKSGASATKPKTRVFDAARFSRVRKPVEIRQTLRLKPAGEYKIHELLKASTGR